MVVAGILLAALYYECTQFSPGGLVTPVYIALCLTEPVRLLYTAVVVALAWCALRILSRFWILYGKRLFAIAVALTFLLDALLGMTGTFPAGIRAIGYIVPALLVRDIDRQGLLKTGLSLGAVTGLCALMMLWLGVL